MTKKSKLNDKAVATLVEYRVALDIKNSIDKLVSQLRSEFTEIVSNHKLVSDKKNFVFEFGNDTFAISQSQRDILNQSEVKKLLTSSFLIFLIDKSLATISSKKKLSFKKVISSSLKSLSSALSPSEEGPLGVWQVGRMKSQQPQ